MATMDRETLLDRLRGIEWDDFEVKEAAGGVPKTAYTTVSAFANTSGGWIVFGVKESKNGFEVVGLADPDKIQNDFLGGCRTTEKFSRPVDVRPHQFEIDDRIVLAFYITPARRFDKPIRVKVDNAWYAYIRAGARDQKCTPEEEGRFLRDASAETFDVQTIPSLTIADLDPSSLRWVRTTHRRRQANPPEVEPSEHEFLEDLGLIREGHITHAAALLLGRPKLIARLKPAGIVDFRLIREAWSEEVPAHRYDDRFLSEVNIIETLRQLIERFTNLIPNAFRLEPATFQRAAQAPEYPALREALVNLLVHQDYSDQHRTARILWYTDRTIFFNPGDSYVTVAQMLDGGASDLRNPRIARLMRQIGFAEQAGTGMPTIVRTWRSVERTPPVVTNDPGRKTYQLTLSWERVVKREDAFWKKLIGASVTPDEARIIDWLRLVGTGTRAEARLATGASMRETRKMIDSLVHNALLVNVDDSSEHVRIAPHIVEILAKVAATQATEQATPQATPHVTPQVTPHATEQVTEQATPEVTPQATPQVTPQVTPHDERFVSVIDGEVTRDELQERLAIADRKHFRDAYLHPALEAGLIEMTIPDKPKSPRQKYRLTEAGRKLVASLQKAKS